MNKPNSLFRMPPMLAAVLAALVQTAVLGYMVETRASILRIGTEVRLKTAPVDPRDLLRGDYVTLGYQISTIDKSIITGEAPVVSGLQTLWVRLVPGADGLWTASQASFAPLTQQEGSVVARTSPFEYYPGLDGQVPDTISVAYGIERYYVPEGEGRVLEEARNAQALEVAARVSTAGRMQIRQILLDGEPAYDEPLY
ncbi:GDYXXLXY domain-containing protein [Rhizobium sp. ARZ01]|uniref:GDYXXLXY domain-containing protein n=1 Tax=Rhizobium sp. ARZ01 TaxID=2769313 RepID=UPI0017819C09|nr:GDYXXLXY domain-containing protein [Rhizobium sp. ARZ01]MBD9372173.1 GDYXXLXY domain-containing protein [Rhizobium sp. ARZ01]